MPPKNSRRGAQNQAEGAQSYGRGRGFGNGRRQGRGRGHGHGRRGRGRGRSERVPTICLDGASPSEESDEEEDTTPDTDGSYLHISSPLPKQNYLSNSFLCLMSEDDDDHILEDFSKSKKKESRKKDSTGDCFVVTPPKKIRKRRTMNKTKKPVTESEDKDNAVLSISETKASRTGDMVKEDDDDEDDISQFVVNPKSTGIIESDESDDFDPFEVNYEANRNIALSAAQVEDHEFQEELELQKQKELLENERLQEIEDKKKEEEELLVIDEAEKSDLMVIDDAEENLCLGKRTTRSSAKQETTAPDCEVIQKKNSLRKMSRKTHAALNRFNMINLRLENDSPNTSFASDVVEVEEIKDYEDITLRLKQGQLYFKHTMNKKTKFSVLFQEIAEKHKVSVSQIFLTLNDEYLDPEKTPKDLGITLCDVIELGVMSAEEDAKDPSTSSGVNSISFKVQTSDRKGSMTVTINRYDKMQVLMNKFAQEKGINVSELWFQFDGEALEPSETPVSLDLEGGECIDVYPKK